MRFCPGWIRSLPTKALQVNTAFGVEDNFFPFEQLLLAASRTDFTLRVDNSLPGDGWPWGAIAQGRHGIAHLSCADWWPDHGCDLPVGGNPPRGNLPDDFIDTVVKRIGHRRHPQMYTKNTLEECRSLAQYTTHWTE
jgi:hypothetical protein